MPSWMSILSYTSPNVIIYPEIRSVLYLGGSLNTMLGLGPVSSEILLTSCFQELTKVVERMKYSISGEESNVLME